MKSVKLYSIAPLFLALLFALQGGGCNDVQPVSSTGVQRATATVAPGVDGLTIEQRNIKDRLTLDNKPGSIKHLYVISAYSGQVLLYSTVRGKVTSSGKRLTPTEAATEGQYNAPAFAVGMPSGQAFRTNEVLQDDGTYGTSVDYLYWWDEQGRYHQQYVTGGMILHISDQPIPVKSVTLNLEAAPTPLGVK